MLHKGKAKRLCCTNLASGLLAIRGRCLIGNQGKQTVELERVDPEPRSEPSEYAGAIILGQIFGERFADDRWVSVPR